MVVLPFKNTLATNLWRWVHPTRFTDDFWITKIRVSWECVWTFFSVSSSAQPKPGSKQYIILIRLRHYRRHYKRAATALNLPHTTCWKEYWGYCLRLDHNLLQLRPYRSQGNKIFCCTFGLTFVHFTVAVAYRRVRRCGGSEYLQNICIGGGHPIKYLLLEGKCRGIPHLEFSPRESTQKSGWPRASTNLSTWLNRSRFSDLNVLC